MNNQMQNNQPTTEKRGGKFCSRCGQPLDATGICHNPGCPTNLNANQFAAQQQPINPQYSAVPHQQPYNQQYQQPYNQQYQQPYYQNAVPQQPSAPTIFSLAWDYVKVFFSSKPLTAVENIGKTAENIWIVLGGAASILISLGLFGIGTQKLYDVNVAQFIVSIKSLISSESLSSYTSNIFNDVAWLSDGFKLFVFLFLTVLLQFFVSAGINNILFSVHKQKVNYLRSLNILSASVLPLALSGIVAFIASYISVMVACSVVLVGVIACYLFLYYGMQKVCRFGKSPLWGFIAVIIANMVSLFVIVTVLGKMFA